MGEMKPEAGDTATVPREWIMRCARFLNVVAGDGIFTDDDDAGELFTDLAATLGYDDACDLSDALSNPPDTLRVSE